MSFNLEHIDEPNFYMPAVLPHPDTLCNTCRSVIVTNNTDAYLHREVREVPHGHVQEHRQRHERRVEELLGSLCTYSSTPGRTKAGSTCASFPPPCVVESAS